MEKRKTKSKDLIKYNVESTEVKNECSGETVFFSCECFLTRTTSLKNILPSTKTFSSIASFAAGQYQCYTYTDHLSLLTALSECKGTKEETVFLIYKSFSNIYIRRA